MTTDDSTMQMSLISPASDMVTAEVFATSNITAKLSEKATEALSSRTSEKDQSNRSMGKLLASNKKKTIDISNAEGGAI
jgi:hypothetical protein